jgi:ATP-dependent DNA ligase
MEEGNTLVGSRKFAAMTSSIAGYSANRGKATGSMVGMGLAVNSDLAAMEATSVAEIPTGEGWQYEPKWDGFRCLAFRDGDEVDLRSKAVSRSPGIFLMWWRPCAR